MLTTKGGFLLHAVFCLAFARFAEAQTLWIGQSGDWFQDGNWSAGVPDPSSDAQINNGGTAQILAGTAYANSLGLGGGPDEALDTGTLLVSGPGSLQIAGGLFLANFGIGTLTILNGGIVNSGPSTIGGSTHFGGSPAVATVDGAGSSWTTSQGLEVDGSLAVQNGGALVSDFAFVNGGALIDGPGSTWTTGEIVVAPSTFASVTIRNGAVLTSDDLSLIGDGPFPGGVTVDGPGSRWNDDFDNTVLIIGFGDLGVLNITGGGVVSTFAAEMAPYDGENGQLLVDGAGSEFDVRSNLSIGGSDGINGFTPGGVGLAQITNGGTIWSTTTTIFGQGTVVDNGTLTSDLVATLPGGVLSGIGSVSGLVDNAGVTAPGDPLGTLTIGSLTEDGTLFFAINGTSPAAQSHLSIGGDAEILGGTVEVRFGEGFLPAQGNVFELIDVAGAVSGSFTHVIFPDLRSGFQFSTAFVNGVYQITALSDGAPAAGLLNISTRGQVGAGDDALIAGFIVTGTVDKQVIIRGLGPSLTSGGTQVPGRLTDPNLELRDQAGNLISSNDNWMDSPQKQEIIDSTIPPSDDHEAAIVATLAPGSYTAILREVADGTGIGLVEVYNLDQNISADLANLSTRGFVATGDGVLIDGFIVDDQDTLVLLRGLGPSLTQAGIADALADPTLELHDGNGDVIAFNNDWQESDKANIQNTGIPPSFDQESAILATLGPGNFTAILRGQNESTGVGLFEIYNLR